MLHSLPRLVVAMALGLPLLSAAQGRPDPVVRERVECGKDRTGEAVSDDRPLPPGREVVEFRTVPWSGTDYPADTAAEGELIRRFFDRLAGVVGRVGFLARELPPLLPQLLTELGE